MPRFTFKLQPVLELREREERDKQLVVAALERERMGLESSISACQDEIRSHKSDLRDLLGGAAETGSAAVADLRLVKLQAAASLHARVRTQRLALQLAGVYQRLDKARAALREAAARRRAVELLKQKQYEQWLRDQKRRESAALDEIAVIQAARREAAGQEDE